MKRQKSAHSARSQISKRETPAKPEAPPKAQKPDQPAKMSTCTFKWYRTPDAKAVLVAGDFTDWNPIPLEKQEDGFLADIKLPPGEYRYKFIVDGEWHNDPMATELVPNGFGTADSVLRVE